jgi:hypothetical protein
MEFLIYIWINIFNIYEYGNLTSSLEKLTLVSIFYLEKLFTKKKVSKTDICTSTFSFLVIALKYFLNAIFNYLVKTF